MTAPLYWNCDSFYFRGFNESWKHVYKATSPHYTKNSTVVAVDHIAFNGLNFLFCMQTLP